MKTTRKKITIVIEKTKTGFSAFAEDYPIFTTAKAIPELIGTTIEATNLYFEDLKNPITQDKLNFIHRS